MQMTNKSYSIGVVRSLILAVVERARGEWRIVTERDLIADLVEVAGDSASTISYYA